jgi:hypothetical protein
MYLVKRFPEVPSMLPDRVTLQYSHVLWPHGLDHSTPMSEFCTSGASLLTSNTSSVRKISHQPQRSSFSAKSKENPMKAYHVSALISGSKITLGFF